MNNIVPSVTTVTPLTPKRRPRTAEQDVLRVALIQRGMNLQALATATGLSLGSIRNICSGGNDSALSRYKIEAAIGRAIWSPTAEFAHLQETSAVLGRPPWALGFRQLQNACSVVGIEGWSLVHKKTVLVDLLVRHLAAMSEQDLRRACRAACIRGSRKAADKEALTYLLLNHRTPQTKTAKTE